MKACRRDEKGRKEGGNEGKNGRWEGRKERMSGSGRRK